MSQPGTRLPSSAGEMSSSFGYSVSPFSSVYNEAQSSRESSKLPATSTPEPNNTTSLHKRNPPPVFWPVPLTGISLRFTDYGTAVPSEDAYLALLDASVGLLNDVINSGTNGDQTLKRDHIEIESNRVDIYIHNEGPARRRLLRMSFVGAALLGIGGFMHDYEVSSTSFDIILDGVGRVGDGFVRDAPEGLLRSSDSF